MACRSKVRTREDLGCPNCGIIFFKRVRFSKIIFLLFALLFKLTCAAHEGDYAKKIEAIHAHKDLAGHTHFGWESRYFSEGRDALDGKSLWTGSVELGYEHFSGGVWYGRSSNHAYDELQYSLSLTQEKNDWSLYAGYSYIVFSKDNESDDEWSFGVAYDNLPYSLGSSIDGTYSMDAEGMFYEWSTYREFSVSDKSNAVLSGILGLNDGYVSDGHNGANFYAMSVGLDRNLTDHFVISCHGMQSFAIDRHLNLVGDEQLKDFFHFGLGFQWIF